MRIKRLGARRGGAFAQAVSWALVAVCALSIFAASAKSGLDYDAGVGLLAQVKQWLGEVLSSIAGHPVDPSPIGHFTEFFIFGVLLSNALAATFAPKAANAKLAALSIALASAYAATDELHQLFVPGRACDVADWLVDSVAAAIGMALMLAVLNRRSGN